MKLEDIILSETSHRQRQILRGIPYMCNLNKKNNQTHRNKVEWWLLGSGGCGE